MAIETQSQFESKINIVENIKENQHLDFEKIGNWIVAGSGNFEKTQTDGRYRDNCNTFREASACKDHLRKSLTLHYNHCNKLDCETCNYYIGCILFMKKDFKESLVRINSSIAFLGAIYKIYYDEEEGKAEDEPFYRRAVKLRDSLLKNGF